MTTHEYKVGDRVVVTRDSGYIPQVKFGSMGTIVDVLQYGLPYPLLVSYDDEPLSNHGWPTSPNEVHPLTPVPETPKTSFMRDISLHPGTKRILLHLKKRKTISPFEAFANYGTMRLAARIHELRMAGHKIKTTLKHDESGKRYSRYSLVAQS